MEFPQTLTGPAAAHRLTDHEKMKKRGL